MQNIKNNFIVKYSDVNVNNVIYDNFSMANDGKHVVSKMWYQQKNIQTNIQPHTFYVQTPALKIHSVPNNQNDDLLLILTDSSIFEQLDKRSVSEIKSQEAHRKYGMIKPTYKSSINNPDDDDTIDVLRLKIGNCKFFYKDKTPRNLQEVLDSSLLQKGSLIKVIIEIGMVMMNIEQNFIFTNLILKQAQILPLQPKIIDLTEYSFVDDEPQINQSDSIMSINIDDVVLNTQTEYINDNSAYSNNSSDSRSTKSTKSAELTKSPKLPLISSLSDIEQKLINGIAHKSDNTLVNQTENKVEQNIQQSQPDQTNQSKQFKTRGRPPKKAQTLIQTPTQTTMQTQQIKSNLKTPEKQVLEIINLAVDNSSDSESEEQSDESNSETKSEESDNSTNSTTSSNSSDSSNLKSDGSYSPMNYNSADVGDLINHLNKLELSNKNEPDKKMTNKKLQNNGKTSKVPVNQKTKTKN